MSMDECMQSIRREQKAASKVWLCLAQNLFYFCYTCAEGSLLSDDECLRPEPSVQGKMISALNYIFNEDRFMQPYS